MKEIMKHFDTFVNYAEQAAPVIWEAMIKQQWVIALSISIIVGLCILILIFGILFANNSDNWLNFSVCIIWIFFFASCIGVIVFLIEGLPRLLNPTYYAIKSLIP